VSKILIQTDILKSVIALLKTKYPATTTKYYTDETVEGFVQPCFFIKLIKSRNTETKNTNSNSLSIILTYFADESTNKQLAYLACEDYVDSLFGKGFTVGGRYLHIQTIASERIGENQDILQIILSVAYLDSTGYDGNAGYELMQHLNQNTKLQGY
jgi:hypothetical protein